MTACGRAGGLERRVPLYASAVLAVALAALELPASQPPSVGLMIGVVAAATIGYALPVGMGTVGLWRAQGSFCEPVLVVCAFMLPVAWGVVLWAGAALFSGLYIRRHRTTPGGMAAGAAQVTLGAAVALMVPRPEVSTVPGYLLCSLYLFWVYRVVAGVGWYLTNGLATGETLSGTLVRNLVPLQRLFGFACGAAMGVAALVLAERHPVLLTTMALPYVALLVGNANASRVQREKDRMEALIDLGGRLQRATGEGEVISIVCDTTAQLQGCGAAEVRDTQPSAGEVGARVPSIDGAPWLVAPVRRGAPSYQGRYRRDEHRLMDLIVSVADAAIENVRLVRHHMDLARVDPVSGLPNRRAMAERLAGEVAAASRTGEAFALLFIDFDHFKAVNDTLGHDAGDEALTAVGQRIASALRAGDIVGRWGGDEYLAILRAPEGGAAAQAAGDRIRAYLRAAPVTVPGGQVEVTASIGAAVFGAHGTTSSDLLAAADTAAAAAKAAGRDQMVLAPRSVLTARAG
jgi:diguanylate cyclase (GGDEF)-like protein